MKFYHPLCTKIYNHAIFEPWKTIYRAEFGDFEALQFITIGKGALLNVRYKVLEELKSIQFNTKIFKIVCFAYIKGKQEGISMMLQYIMRSQFYGNRYNYTVLLYL